jgi:hypothetical protein
VSTASFSLIIVVIVKPLWFDVVDPPVRGTSGMLNEKVTSPCGTVTTVPVGSPGIVVPSGCVKTMDGSSARP